MRWQAANQEILGRARSVTVPPWFRWAFLALVIGKFILVSHEEILPYLNDDSGFAQSAGVFYWKARWSEYAYVKPPVYPLFVSGTMLLGLPTRLAAELVWALACWALAKSLWRCGMGAAAGLVGGAVTLYHPWSIDIMNRLLMDALYVPLFTIMLAALAMGMAAESRDELRKRGLAAAFAGALAANTRQESILVYATIALAAVIIAAWWWLGLADSRLARRRLVAMVVAPFLATFLVTQAICAANYSRIGSWVTYDLNLPGYRALYQSLLAIPPKSPRLDIPIPRDVRDRAYRASPTFARLEPFLDGGQGAPDFQRACEQATKVKGEFGGWTIWAMRDAAWRMGDYKWESARELDAFYTKAAAELRIAMARGELEHRATPLPFVPPEWGLMARGAPEVAGRCAAMLFSPLYRRNYTAEARGWELENFDAVANRRTAPAAISRGAEVQGSTWHRAPGVAGADRAKVWLSHVVRYFMRVGGVAGLVGLCMAAWCTWRGRKNGTGEPRGRGAARPWHPSEASAYWAFVLLFAGALAMRFGLVVLLDLGAVGAQERYLLPAVPMIIALETAGIVGAARAISWWLGSRSGSARGITMDLAMSERGPDQGAMVAEEPVSSSASAPAS